MFCTWEKYIVLWIILVNGHNATDECFGELKGLDDFVFLPHEEDDEYWKGQTPQARLVNGKHKHWPTNSVYIFGDDIRKYVVNGKFNFR